MVSTSSGFLPVQPDLFPEPVIRLRRLEYPPRRVSPYNAEPGYYASGGIWLYGNVRLLQAKLRYVDGAAGPNRHTSRELASIEAEAEQIVFDGQILVCGVHSEAHRRASVVPLRWGAPRIVVLSGGFQFHLGTELKDEPFRLARLWRYQWDPLTDLAVSRRAPDKLPTYSAHNPTVDRTIESLARGLWPGLRAGEDPLDNLLAASS